MTRLQQLHDGYGQSPWLDNLTRDYLRDGTLARMVSEGIRGVTANPTIFAKAIEGSNAYDAQFADLLRAGRELIDAYWDVVVDDVVGALGVLRPVYDASGVATGSSRSRSPPSWPTTSTGRSGRHRICMSGSTDRTCSSRSLRRSRASMPSRR